MKRERGRMLTPQEEQILVDLLNELQDAEVRTDRKVRFGGKDKKRTASEIDIEEEDAKRAAIRKAKGKAKVEGTSMDTIFQELPMELFVRILVSTVDRSARSPLREYSRVVSSMFISLSLTSVAMMRDMRALRDLMMALDPALGRWDTLIARWARSFGEKGVNWEQVRVDLLQLSSASLELHPKPRGGAFVRFHTYYRGNIGPERVVKSEQDLVSAVNLLGTRITVGRLQEVGQEFTLTAPVTWPHLREVTVEGIIPNTTIPFLNAIPRPYRLLTDLLVWLQREDVPLTKVHTLEVEEEEHDADFELYPNLRRLAFDTYEVVEDPAPPPTVTELEGLVDVLWMRAHPQYKFFVPGDQLKRYSSVQLAEMIIRRETKELDVVILLD